HDKPDWQLDTNWYNLAWEVSGMLIEQIVWDLDDDPDGNVRHIAEDGLSVDEVIKMPERIRRQQKLKPDEAARLRAARAEFKDKPTKAKLLRSGEYAGPMSLDEYLSWRKGAGDAPLTRQLQAAIAATEQSLYSIA